MDGFSAARFDELINERDQLRDDVNRLRLALQSIIEPSLLGNHITVVTIARKALEQSRKTPTV